MHIATKAVQTIYDEYDLRLPAHLRNKLQKHPKDPARHPELDQVRIRILPTPKRPVKFWSSRWCFYEIAGENMGGPSAPGSTLITVQFFQASNTKVCGAGHYRDPVEKILQDVQMLRPKELYFQSIGGNSHYVHLLRRFRYSDANWRPAVAAADLIWIIEQTLSRFQALPPPI